MRKIEKQNFYLTWRQARLLIDKVGKTEKSDNKSGVFHILTTKGRVTISIDNYIDANEEMSVLKCNNHTLTLKRKDGLYRLVMSYLNSQGLNDFKKRLFKSCQLDWNIVMSTRFAVDKAFQKKREFTFTKTPDGYNILMGDISVQAVPIVLAKHIWDNYLLYWSAHPLSLEEVYKVYYRNQR